MYQRLIEKERQENQCNNFYVRKTSLDLGSIALMSLSFVCSVNHQFEYTPHLLNESSTTLKKNYRMLLFSCYIYSFPIVKFFSLRKENGSKKKMLIWLSKDLFYYVILQASDQIFQILPSQFSCLKWIADDCGLGRHKDLQKC